MYVFSFDDYKITIMLHNKNSNEKNSMKDFNFDSCFLFLCRETFLQEAVNPDC